MDGPECRMAMICRYDMWREEVKWGFKDRWGMIRANQISSDPGSYQLPRLS